jgi:hypothetical protein
VTPVRRIQGVENINWAHSLAGGLIKLRLGSDAGNDKLKPIAAAIGEPSMSVDAARLRGQNDYFAKVVKGFKE